MKNLLLWSLVALLAWACSPEPQQGPAESTHEEPAEEAAAEAAAEKAHAEGTSPFPADSMGQDGRSFHGFRIEEQQAMPVSQLTASLQDQGELNPVKIKGTVDAACKMKGCWMTMKLPDGADMRIRFKDYGFFVPKDCAGKTAVVEGKAYYDTTSVVMLRHYAIDAGMSEKEAEQKYQEPEVALAFEATGVIIK